MTHSHLMHSQCGRFTVRKSHPFSWFLIGHFSVISTSNTTRLHCKQTTTIVSLTAIETTITNYAKRSVVVLPSILLSGSLSTTLLSCSSTTWNLTRYFLLNFFVSDEGLRRRRQSIDWTPSNLRLHMNFGLYPSSCNWVLKLSMGNKEKHFCFFFFAVFLWEEHIFSPHTYNTASFRVHCLCPPYPQHSLLSAAPERKIATPLPH